MGSKGCSIILPKVKWTTEMETALINLIEKKPHLWDSKNENYLKKSLKHHSFREIGSIMKERWPEYSQLFTHENLVNKFANLRSYYRREWKKQKHMRSGGEGESFVPKWDHFTRLNFLEDALLRETGEGNLDSTPLELCEVTMPSEVILPDTELDSRDHIRDTPTQSRSRMSPAPCFPNGEESYHRKRYKRRHSTDDSSNDVAVPSTSQKIIPYPQPSAPSVNYLCVEGQMKRDMPDKDSPDSAFCHYLYTMLLGIPDSFEKELAKIRIMETILKLKYPPG